MSAHPLAAPFPRGLHRPSLPRPRRPRVGVPALPRIALPSLRRFAAAVPGPRFRLPDLRRTRTTAPRTTASRFSLTRSTPEPRPSARRLPRIEVPALPPVSLTATARRVRARFGRVATLPPPVPVPEEWRGSGPVVVVGGFCTSTLAMDPLCSYLRDLGYTVTTCTVDAGMGCGGRSVERLRSVVRDAAAADPDGHGVRLVGYSRGGQFARAVARDPDLPVRSLVTLGTPFEMFGVSRPLLLQIAAVALAGSLGVRGLFTLACMTGPCCAGFRDTLRAPVPVPFSAICSRGDGLVRWSACQDPTAHLVEVPGHHLALLSDAAPLLAVAEQLHRCDHSALAAAG